MEKYDLSIVIPVGNDSKVMRTLDSITNSHHDCKPEIILVDNNCDPELRQAFHSYNATFPIKVVEEPSKHIGRLRNKAMEKSEAGVFYFVDSDCVLSPDAIQKAHDYSQEHSVVRGRIEFIGKSRLSTLDAKLRKARYDADATFAYCPNLVVRRKIFDTCGCFNEEFRYGSDGEFARRIRNEKVPVHYAPDMEVTHDGSISNRRVMATWVRYGEGRYRRLKEASLKERVRGLFAPNLFDAGESLSYNIVVTLCLTSRWYGWTKESIKNAINW